MLRSLNSFKKYTVAHIIDGASPWYRLVTPVLLRGLLRWLRSHGGAGGPGSTSPVGQGWMYAGMLSITGFALAIAHSQLFW